MRSSFVKFLQSKFSNFGPALSLKTKFVKNEITGLKPTFVLLDI